MVDRRPLVIEHTHRKRRVENTCTAWQLVQAQRQHMYRPVVHEVPDGEKLHDVQDCRIDADHISSALSAHSHRVVAIAAADIEYIAAIEWCDLAAQASPLQIASPFGINPHAAHVEGALAPGRQSEELQFQRLTFCIAQAINAHRNDIAGQIRAAIGEPRQSLNGLAPLPEVAVRRIRQTFAQHGLELLRPSIQSDIAKARGQEIIVEHC